jgi:hypothetical protein
MYKDEHGLDILRKFVGDTWNDYKFKVVAPVQTEPLEIGITNEVPPEAGVVETPMVELPAFVARTEGNTMTASKLKTLGAAHVDKVIQELNKRNAGIDTSERHFNIGEKVKKILEVDPNLREAHAIIYPTSPDISAAIGSDTASVPATSAAPPPGPPVKSGEATSETGSGKKYFKKVIKYYT